METIYRIRFRRRYGGFVWLRKFMENDLLDFTSAEEARNALSDPHVQGIMRDGSTPELVTITTTYEPMM